MYLPQDLSDAAMSTNMTYFNVIDRCMKSCSINQIELKWLSLCGFIGDRRSRAVSLAAHQPFFRLLPLATAEYQHFTSSNLAPFGVLQVTVY